MTRLDKRHLRRMLPWISLMRRERCSVWRGARAMDGFYHALEASDETWYSELQSHIVTLELAGTDSEILIAQMGNEYHEFVNETLDRLEEIILSRFPGGIVPTEDEEEEDEEE